MLKPFRREGLVIALIALTAFSFHHALNTQDISRLALTQAVWSDGSVRIDRWSEGALDIARYDGHYYSDKAPGMSFVALPLYALFRVADVVDGDMEDRGVWRWDGLLWLLRLSTAGFGFVAVVFLVGRVSEGIATGTGAASATAFGLGTLVLPMAATTFGHVSAAALGFGAFVAAWSAVRRSEPRALLFALAGLSAGAAVLFEYQAAIVAIVLLAYIGLRTARGSLVYAAGGIPSVIALGTYNTVAFDSPLRFSYHYVSEPFADLQAKGFFGIGVPDPSSLADILLSSRGLAVQTPVLVLAAAGLVLLWRAGLRAESAVCATVTAFFVLMPAGYFSPMGGVSPGVRFFIPALPFLAVGLPAAFRRWPMVTLVASTISIGAMFYRSLTWSRIGPPEYDTVWEALLSSTVGGVIVTGAFALAALLLSAHTLLAAYGPWSRSDEPPAPAPLAPAVNQDA